MIQKFLAMLQKTALLLFFSVNHICFSQALSVQSFHTIEMPEESGEEIFLETDRLFYCTDEKIYFTADYSFNYPIADVQWSKVIYMELIRWNGEKIAQAKYKLNENSASGYLTIPPTVLSGNYYLRAYTKWMRNYPIEEYALKMIKVINPYESKIDQGPVRESDNGSVQFIPLKGNSSNCIECFTDKSTYRQREKVELAIRLNKHDHDLPNFCISVAKAANIDTNRYCIQIRDKISPDENSLIYLPEFRGISISGKILDAGSKMSIANTTIHLSTPQNWKHFTSFHTGDNGLFYFTLPDFYGQLDFYIDAVLENRESADILIDNDYCNRSIQLTYLPFSLDTIEKKIALEMAVNMQLSRIFSEESTMHTIESGQDPFYVRPDHIYNTETYVQLPNLEEFFFELVKEVRTVKIQGQTDLRMVAYSQYRNLKPLILLDNIAVSDLEEFLKIPLDRIEKIEIIDKPYIVSGLKYSGVICVSTKRKDFAGIELNKNSLFFSYDLLSDGSFNIPDYSSPNTKRETYRHNLLLWDPDIELTQDHPQTLSFYTSDSKGEYIVYIRSINANDKPQLYGTCKIVVE